ncbi:MAG: hypothetical protein H0W53_18285 [Acidobacteria bacterium]|nr:hypothetical protein [Acidobacteriota bacterium]
MRLLAGVLLLISLQACGGGGGSGSTPPPPAPGGGNPCSTASTTGLAAPVDGALQARKRRQVDGGNRYNVLNELSLHRQRAVDGTAAASPDAALSGRDGEDIGEIAVIRDEGDIVAPPNTFDLRNAGVRFTRNGSGGYDARKIDPTFRQTLGRQLTLGDDASASAPLSVNFNFYGTPRADAFVNSDGNITFGEEDVASTERNVARFLTGPPRVSPFLADLDPSTAGRIFVNATSDIYSVTWCTVRGFESTRTITTQLSLLPDGSIEFIYGNNSPILGDAVVGVSPGRTGDFTPVNLSEPGPTGGSAAVGERFAASPQLDTVALLRKFYQTHPDNYDQVLIWTDAPLIQDAFAFETTIANEVRGLGLPVFDASRDFGSAGRLRSIAVMDWLGKYPEDPRQKFLGENTTLSVMGQEVGHRWLAFFDFRDHTSNRSSQLLGRGESHWSFFFDSDASVMEGNDIEDLGGGSFRTAGAVARFSLLDQYAMGLVAPSEVPSFFYVQNPTNLSAARTRESGPEVGITFNGTRREVLLEDIVAVHGPREPTAASAAKVHRQAFIYLSSAGTAPPASAIAKLDNFRRQWEGFFLSATDGRMTAITTLR